MIPLNQSVNWQRVMHSQDQTRDHSIDRVDQMDHGVTELEGAEKEIIRTQQLLVAMNKASMAMQEAVLPEDIFVTVGDVLKELGFSCVVLLISEDGMRLFPRYVSYSSGMVKAAEKLTGIDIGDFTIAIDDLTIYREIVRVKRTVFEEDSERITREVLPEFAKPFSEQIVNLLQVPRFIMAPLIVEDVVIGIISVQSDDLTENDIPTITAFANQMATVWWKASLMQELENRLVELKGAESALRQSEEKFRKIFERADDGIIYLDNSGTIVEANGKLLQTLGYDQQEAVGQKFNEIGFFKPEHRDKIEHYFDQYTELGEVYSFTEFEVLHKDGHTVFIEASASLFQQSDDKEAGLLIVVRDVTRRKQAEEALRQSEEQFRNIIENATDIIYTHDLQGNFTSANPVVTQVYGYNIDEVLQLNIKQIVAPGYLPLAERMISEKLNGASETGPYELLTYRKNGESVWVEVSTRLIERDGQPVGVQGIARDITERKRAEEQTMQRNRELAAINAIAQTVSQSLDLEETLNAALDRTLEILDIEHAGIVLMDEDRKRVVLRFYRGISDYLAESFPSIEVGKGNLGYVAQSGEPLFVESLLNMGDSMHENMEILTSEYQLESAMLLPLKVRGKILGVMFAATRDKRIFTPEERNLLTTISHQISTAIENIQLLEAASQAIAMEKTDRLRSAFLASISHEIRTPLTSIKGLANTLTQPDVDWDSETQKEFLGIINQESDRLVLIVGDVLDMSKLETGAMKLYQNWVSIDVIISELDVVLSNIMLEHNLELCLANDLPLIFADQIRIGQVITNLWGNAVAHSPDGSQIVLEAHVSDDNLVVSVTDSGEGIPTEELERIFDIFYRIEENTERRRRGSGLGLAICKGIVEAHGGTIWAESEGIGKGSTIHFAIPLQVKKDHVQIRR